MPKRLIPKRPEDPREEIFIRALAAEPTIASAARAAGYPQKQLDNGWIYQKLQTKKMQEKIRDYYGSHSIALLPAIHSIESDVIRDAAQSNDMEKKSTVLRQHTAVLKQIKQATGVLSQDAAPGVQTIHIHQLQAVIQQAIPDKGEKGD